MPQSKMANSELFELTFFAGRKAELLQVVDLHMNAHQYSLLSIFTPNPEQIMTAQSSPDFLAALQQADILIPDGMGVVWASRVLSLSHKLTHPLKEKIGGRELTEALLAKYAERNILVIGGKGYDAHQLGSNVCWTPGYQDVTRPTLAEEEQLAEVIKKLHPEVVFVAFGAPYQEYWVLANQGMLEKSKVRLVMVVGGTFDVLTGKLKRPPAWMRQVGLEWLYRLYQEPWRWRRQTRLFSFIWLTLREMF